jgi:hypothetical protein
MCSFRNQYTCLLLFFVVIFFYSFQDCN